MRASRPRLRSEALPVWGAAPAEAVQGWRGGFVESDGALGFSGANANDQRTVQRRERLQGVAAEACAIGRCRSLPLAPRASRARAACSTLCRAARRGSFHPTAVRSTRAVVRSATDRRAARMESCLCCQLSLLKNTVSLLRPGLRPAGRGEAISTRISLLCEEIASSPDPAYGGAGLLAMTVLANFARGSTVNCELSTSCRHRAPRVRGRRARPSAGPLGAARLVALQCAPRARAFGVPRIEALLVWSAAAAAAVQGWKGVPEPALTISGTVHRQECLQGVAAEGRAIGRCRSSALAPGSSRTRAERSTDCRAARRGVFRRTAARSTCAGGRSATVRRAACAGSCSYSSLYASVPLCLTPRCLSPRWLRSLTCGSSR